MALQDILKKILDDNAEDLKILQSEAEQQKQEIEKQFDTEEQKALQDLVEKENSAHETLKNKIDSMARRENSRAMLASKQTLIETALKLLEERLVNSPDDVYKNILKALFAKMDISEGTIYAPKSRIDLTRSCAPKSFKVAPDESITSGFFVRSNSLEIDNSFHNLIFSEYRSELSSYFAEQLKLV